MTVHNQEITNKFILSKEYKRNLVFLKNYNSFYLWQGGWYKFLKDDEIKSLIFDFISKEYPKKNVTSSLVNDIFTQVKWKVIEKRENEDKNYICFKNKVYNLNTFEFEEFNPKKIITYYFPFNVSELEQEIPNFTNFLKTSLVKEGTNDTDNELISLVQEMMGYFLLDRMEAATFFLVGDGANGKSKLCDTVMEMIGRQFCSSMNIETLTIQRFSTTNLIGKRLNVSNEEESKYMKSDKFKALITGEQITAERKGGDHFEFIPSTKYLFASNEIPTFSSINHGLIRRIKIIPFHRKFKEKEQDKQLLQKLYAELPGIMSWALDGAKRLKKNGFRFSRAKSSDTSIREFENEISSGVRFVRDEYEINPELGLFTSNIDLYIDYRKWCDENGKKPINKISFCRDVVKNIEGVSDKTFNNIRGKNIIKKQNINLDDINFKE